jgi:hypothetical protein
MMWIDNLQNLLLEVHPSVIDMVGFDIVCSVFCWTADVCACVCARAHRVIVMEDNARHLYCDHIQQL